MINRQARFALIGCGRISENHLDAIHNAPSAKLVAVCDIVEEKAKAVAKKQGLSKWYTDLDEMLENEEIDVCCVLVPSGLHAEVAIKVAQHKVNVLCEKPLDITKEKMKAMIQACKDNDVKLGAIFQRRSFMAAQETKKAIENGTLGRVTMGDAYLKYYRDQAYYDSGDWRGTWELDAVCDVVEEKAKLRAEQYGAKKIYTDYQEMLKDPEIECVSICTPSGMHGQMAKDVAAAGKHVFCEKPMEITKEKLDDVIEFVGKTNVKMGCVFQRRCDPSFMAVKEAIDSGRFGKVILADAIINDRKPAVTPREARGAVDLILAIYQSSNKKREITM